MGDGDDTYDYADWAFIAARSGADVVVGNRYKGGDRRSAMTWTHLPQHAIPPSALQRRLLTASVACALLRVAFEGWKCARRAGFASR
jgi:hypothetical protein